MRIRLRFAKYDTMKYIGHLDMMRYFQKVFRRALVPMKYSEGFNPHPVMSFASPLGVGVTSEGEYMDMELTKDVDLKELVDAVNKEMVEGVEVLSAIELGNNDKKAMAAVSCADYIIYFKKNAKDFSAFDISKEVKNFYDSSDITVIKKTKKGEKEMDIKPFIFAFEGDCFSDSAFLKDLRISVKNEEFCCEDEDPVFYLKVSTGSNDNIKPELVFQAFYEFLGMENNYDIAIHRLNLYQGEAPNFKPLGE